MERLPREANRPEHVQTPFTLPRYSTDEALHRADDLMRMLRGRRSCRFFSDEPVAFELIERCIETANLAPSGANRQPWRFVVVDDPAIKREIREAAEAEEKESYEKRMPGEWLDALRPIGTDWRKPFLESAPYLVVVFRVDWEEVEGVRRKAYYIPESVGLACGFFLAACQNIGLATLTHTPSPMGFLRQILRRPENEKPFLLIPVGYPAAGAVVPNLVKKSVGEIMVRNRGGMV